MKRHSNLSNGPVFPQKTVCHSVEEEEVPALGGEGFSSRDQAGYYIHAVTGHDSPVCRSQLREQVRADLGNLAVAVPRAADSHSTHTLSLYKEGESTLHVTILSVPAASVIARAWKSLLSFPDLLILPVANPVKAAQRALFSAIVIVVSSASSVREKAIRWPPASTTATLISFPRASCFLEYGVHHPRCSLSVNFKTAFVSILLLS